MGEADTHLKLNWKKNKEQAQREHQEITWFDFYPMSMGEDRRKIFY